MQAALRGRFACAGSNMRGAPPPCLVRVLAELAGRHARPLPERAGKTLLVVEAHRTRDLLDRSRAAPKLLDRELAAGVILQVLQGRAFVVQLSVQGARRDVEFTRQGIGRRQVRATLPQQL